jgi:hypothetical protein
MQVISAYAELMSTPISPNQPSRIGPNTLVYCINRTEWLTTNMQPCPNPSPTVIKNKKANVKEYFDYERVIIFSDVKWYNAFTYTSHD